MMKWRLRAVTLVVMVLVSGVQLAEAQSATVAVSVTVLPSPLYVEIGPECAFVVRADSKTVDCTVTLVVGQATFEFEGWRATVKVTGIRDSATGKRLPARNVSLLSAETLRLTWGQTIDRAGGPFVPGTSLNGSLNHGRVIVAAKPGFGNGGYRTVLCFRMRVPSHQAPGTYVPTWKLSVANSFA